MTTVLSIPQWQGSSASTARLLAAGARQTCEQIPGDAHFDVPVAKVEGVRRAGVKALNVLVENVQLIGEALKKSSDRVIVAGGDCGVELAPISTARALYGPDLMVLWLDAHPDVNSPETLPSGSFHGMVLRTLLGDGPSELVPNETLEPDQVVLIGVRAFEPGEREYIADAGILRRSPDEVLAFADVRTRPVYVHIDLDVLDPATFSAIGYPEPDGLTPAQVVDIVAGLPNIIGAGITEHAPARHNQAESDVIREIGEALCEQMR